MNRTTSQSTVEGQPWEPRPYQLDSVRFLLEHGAAGLLLDPGLGKTSSVLAALKVLKQNGVGGRALVIAPMRVCHLTWPAEARKWTDFHDLKVVVLHGKDKEKMLDVPADVYCINPEGLKWLLGNGRLKKLKVDTLIVDESTKFKNSQGKRFKLLKEWLGVFKRRWILTGTPMPNGYEDLFGQLYILDLGRALGRYISHYRREYFTPIGFDWVLQRGGAERIIERIKPLTLRLEAKDHIQIPELLENPIPIELPKEVMERYKEVEGEFLSLLDGGVALTAANAAVAGGMCRQIVNGAIYRPADMKDNVQQPFPADVWRFKRQKDDYIVLHDEKVDALRDLHEQLQGAPLLVAYEFNHDLDRLQKAFPYARCLKGDARQLAATERDWNAGRIPMLLGHPASIGHGLNLQGDCQHVAAFGFVWDFDAWEQFIKRVQRSGNRHAHVFLHLLYAKGTVDERVMRAWAFKGKVQNRLLRALKDEPELPQAARKTPRRARA